MRLREVHVFEVGGGLGECCGNYMLGAGKVCFGFWNGTQVQIGGGIACDSFRV